MAKKPINELQAKLGSTLDKIAHLPLAPSVAEPVTAEPAVTASKTKRNPVSAVVVRGKRTSVNVFDADLELLDPLRDFLRKRTGTRVIRDSTLIQVLCRAYKPDDATVAAFKEVTSLDQRRKA